MSFLHVTSSDGLVFDFSVEELACSKLLSRIAGDASLVSNVKLDNIDSTVMANIQRFMKLTVNSPGEWMESFIEECSNEISQLLEAANFLEITTLCDAIADTISRQMQQCRTIESMRASFHIVNDMTPFEESCARKQVEWALSEDDRSTTDPS